MRISFGLHIFCQLDDQIISDIFVVMLNVGGCSICFLTLHNSAERIRESRYFSGNVGGTTMSRSIWFIMPSAFGWLC